MNARTIGIAGALFLIVVLLAATVIDPSTPPFPAAVLGVVFGMILMAVLSARDE